MAAARLDEIAAKHGIRLLLQFGSTVSGRTHAHSDLDLAVLLDRVPDSYAAHGELIADLQTLFPGREIDLAILNHADPLLLEQITRRAVLVHGPVRALHELKISAFKRYQDHRRFLPMEHEYVVRKTGAPAR